MVRAARFRDRGAQLAMCARRTRRRGSSRSARGGVRGQGTCRRSLGNCARGGVGAQADAHSARHGRDVVGVGCARGHAAFRRRRRHGDPSRGGHRCVLTVRERSVVASVPTAAVPVTTQIRRVARYRDDVSGSRSDRAVATGADVVLRGLVRLDSSHLDGPVETVPDSRSSSLRWHGVNQRMPTPRVRDSLRSPWPRRRCRCVASHGAVAGRIPW